MTFNVYYGAAPTEVDVLIAVDSIDAEVYSFGQPTTADGPTLGTPNTFIFAFSGVGGQPLDRIQVRKKADLSRSDPGTTNGYTIVVTNPTTKTITMTSLVDTLPAGFTYVPGTTTGATTSDPMVSESELTWAGPFTILPAKSMTLHFNVMVGAGLLPGMHYNSAGGQAQDPEGSPIDVRPAVNVAPVEVPPPTIATDPDASAPTGSVTTDPDTGEITVSMPAPHRSDVTVSSTVMCPVPPGGKPTSVTLLLNAVQYPMTEDPPGSDHYTATIPAAEVATGPMMIRAVCGGVPYDNIIGRIQLYDPSGKVTDSDTGLSVEGATVTLYKVPGWLPDTPTETRDCRTVDTRIGGVWTQPAPVELGEVADPDLAPPEIDPTVNPQLTNVEGRYGWNVVAGCWYVVVAAPNYLTKVSPVVGVPPAVTDLDVELEPQHPPTADAGGPYTVAEGGQVTLSGTGSDPDMDPLSYAWDLNNDGTFETPGQSVTFSAAESRRTRHPDRGAASV